MAQYGIYWSYLTEKAQDKLKGLYHENIDMSPIAIIDIEDEEEDDDDIEPVTSNGYFIIFQHIISEKYRVLKKPLQLLPEIFETSEEAYQWAMTNIVDKEEPEEKKDYYTYDEIMEKFPDAVFDFSGLENIHEWYYEKGTNTPVWYPSHKIDHPC